MAGRVPGRIDGADAGRNFRLALDQPEILPGREYGLMRVPSGLRASGSFSTRPGSVHHLYSVALTTSSALG